MYALMHYAQYTLHETSKSKRKWICGQQFAYNNFANMKIGQIADRFSTVTSTHKKSN